MDHFSRTWTPYHVAANVPHCKGWEIILSLNNLNNCTYTFLYGICNWIRFFLNNISPNSSFFIQPTHWNGKASRVSGVSAISATCSRFISPPIEFSEAIYIKDNQVVQSCFLQCNQICPQLFPNLMLCRSSEFNMSNRQGFLKAFTLKNNRPLNQCSARTLQQVPQSDWLCVVRTQTIRYVE